MLKVTEFVNHIYSDDGDKKIVYIAVGSSHHMAKVEDGKKIIEDRFNQQYPSYIRDIHVKNPDHKLYIVLIDPLLENPSYTIAKKIPNPSIDDIDDGWYRTDYFNVYENEENNVMLMEFRNCVSYADGYAYGENNINIDYQLNMLNQIALVDKWFVNVMDYCGRNLYGLACGYDKDLGKDKDHIFYGLASRVDGGCYIDLSEKSVYFVSNRDKGYITAFTPYNYNKDQLSIIFHKISNKSDMKNIIMKEQIKIAYERVIKSFKNDVLTIFRRLLIYNKNLKEGKKNIEFYERDYEYINAKYKIKLSNTQELNLKIEEIVSIVSNLLDEEFKYMVEFFNKEELYPKYSEAKKIDDAYKMYSEVCKVVSEFM